MEGIAWTLYWQVIGLIILLTICIGGLMSAYYDQKRKTAGFQEYIKTDRGKEALKS